MDRLRRPPALGAVRRPARGRRPLAHVGLGRAAQAAVVGQPRVRLDSALGAPAASLSVKLCDVFPDGTSALITRGTLDLAPRRSGAGATGARRAVRRRPAPRRLRLPAGRPATGSGSQWPARTGRTPSPRPAPVTLTVHGGTLTLPALARLGDRRRRVRRPARSRRPRTPRDVTWSITDDVCAAPRPARCAAVSSYEIPARRHRAGRTTGARSASTDAASPSGPPPRRRTASPGPASSVAASLSTLRVDIGPDGYDVVIEADAFDDDEQVGHREWREHLPR